MESNNDTGMRSGVNDCVVLITKRSQKINAEVIKLPQGDIQSMRNNEMYKYSEVIG